MTLNHVGAAVVGAGLITALLTLPIVRPGAEMSVPSGGARPLSPTETDSLAADLVRHAERLHNRGNQAPAFRTPARNPFQFAPRAPEPRPATARVPRAEAPDIPPAAPPAPRPTLAGIAEDIGAEGVVRTAVLSDRGQLFLVKEGEQVGVRYRVVRIGADAVELEDLTDQSTVRLGLK